MLKFKNNEVVIGSVFIDGERTKTWYRLQTEFIKVNTKKFKHVACVNGSIDKSILKNSDVIEASFHNSLNEKGLEQSKNHFHGISKIFEYFKEQKSEYCLLLDCDCFPIDSNWLEFLIEKLKDKNKSIAAPIRAENLDLFPHPSAMFFQRDILFKNWFDLSIGETNNLMYNIVKDVGCQLPLDKCYPLMRTNQFNFHPIFGAIYSNIFYHHTCGSRPKKLLTRGIANNIFSNMVKNHWEIEEELFKKIKNDPQATINKLRGLY